MKDLNLFRSPDGAWITSTQLLSTLERVKAHEARILYMHTGLTFGPPNLELGRKELLAALYEIVRSLGVPTLMVPTFTFSFCNGEDYHVQKSRSRMGALNEYIRQLPGAVRSIDPLLSTAAIGEDLSLVRDLGKHSIGENSTFDKVHHRGRDVKFLFFGATASECFTYSHYVEERLACQYRYLRDFTGSITDGDRTWTDTYSLFVRYKGVVVSPEGLLESELLRRGLLLKETCGTSSISAVAEPDAWDVCVEQLGRDPNCYVADGADSRDTEFVAKNMVSL
jgi:aminoglycoside 3-N-acetyltransferase